MRRFLTFMRVACLRMLLAITVVRRCLGIIRLAFPLTCGVVRRRCGEIAYEELDKHSAKVDAHYGNLAIVPVFHELPGLDAPHACLHLRVSRRGSNNYKMRRSCLDCGHLAVTAIAN